MRWQGVFQISLILAVLFTASILFLEPILAQVSLLPDQGASWYYWKLPEPQLVSQISAWSGYLLHQVFIWSVIAWAQNHRQQLRRPTPGLHKINYIALLGSAFFIGLHMLQTATFYDGLAQDMSVFSSQASVVLVLVIVLLLEAPRRGLLLGHGKSWFAHIRPTLVRYHGYYFSWAVVYTFWFHPMETSLGPPIRFFLHLYVVDTGWLYLHTCAHKPLLDSGIRTRCTSAWCHCGLSSRARVLAHVCFWFFVGIHHYTNARYWPFYCQPMGTSRIARYSNNLGISI